jgi:hypothetical protein
MRSELGMSEERESKRACMHACICMCMCICMGMHAGVGVCVCVCGGGGGEVDNKVKKKQRITESCVIYLAGSHSVWHKVPLHTVHA